MNYVYGWFFIDFISIFPFDLLLDGSMITKLFRLFRMPRLLKFLDVSKFKSLMRSFSAGYTDGKVIVRQYYILYSYNVIRLMIIGVLLTYFTGCFFYFISKELNTK